MEVDKQYRYDRVYMNMAKEWSSLSHCIRKKVGSLIVKDRTIISDGYNGSASGLDNNCEDCDNKTHWYVIHAEANAIIKCARNGSSCEGATMYITHSPCKECSLLIFQSGIKRLVYGEFYRDLDGLNFLKESGIEIIKLEI